MDGEAATADVEDEEGGLERAKGSGVGKRGGERDRRLSGETKLSTGGPARASAEPYRTATRGAVENAAGTHRAAREHAGRRVAHVVRSAATACYMLFVGVRTGLRVLGDG